MPLIIGLTGGIATGKSTVAEMFKQSNIPVIDSDIIAKQALEIGTACYKKVVKTFGTDIKLPTGHINRKKLADIVFNDKEKRGLLNSIVHPVVREEIEKKIKQYRVMGDKCIVVDVPLLFESKFDSMMDKIVVVYASPEQQVVRCMERDKIDRESAISRIKAQMSIEEKAKQADYVVYNDTSVLDTKDQFNKLIKKFKCNKKSVH